MVPRNVFVDLDPTVIDSIMVSKHRWLFNRCNYIKGKEDAAGNFARGYYTIGKEIVDNVFETIRKEVEACESL